MVVATSAAGAALLWYFGRRVEDSQGAHSWALGMALTALFFLLALRRAALPEFVTGPLASALGILSVGAMHRGACQICDRPFRWWWHASVAVGFASAVALYFGSAPERYPSRTVIGGSINVVQMLVVAATMWRRATGTSSEEQRARDLTAAAFGMAAALQVLRVVAHTPLVGTDESALVAQSFMSRAAGVTFLVWSLLFPILIAYLNTARAHHRLRTAIEKLQQALSEVKTLRGLLPICASCRRVRESDNSWSTFRALPLGARRRRHDPRHLPGVRAQAVPGGRRRHSRARGSGARPLRAAHRAAAYAARCGAPGG
jgi:hypothetical protein